MKNFGRARRGEAVDGPERGTAYTKALDLLAARPHFALELSTKLTRRGFSAEAVGSAVDRLLTEDYLDDLEAGRSFARERVGRRGWGPRRLRAELARRGVDEGIVERLVDEAFADGEAAAVRHAAAQWANKGGRDRDRLARFLDRRGFSTAAIVEILSEFAPGTDGYEEP